MKKTAVFVIITVIALFFSYGITHKCFSGSPYDSLHHIECAFTMTLELQPGYVSIDDKLNYSLKIQNLTSEEVTWSRFNKLCDFGFGGKIKKNDDNDMNAEFQGWSCENKKFSYIPPRGYTEIKGVLDPHVLIVKPGEKGCSKSVSNLQEIKKLSGASCRNFTVKPLSPYKILVYENTVPVRFCACMQAKMCKCFVCSNDVIVFLDLSPQPGKEGQEWQFLTNGKKENIDFPSSLAGTYVSFEDFLAASDYTVISIDFSHGVINLRKGKKTHPEI